MMTVGTHSTSAESTMRAVTAAPADQPADMSALAKMPESAKHAAEPTASRKPAKGAKREARITSD